MNYDEMIKTTPGGWVSRAMRPVREDNNGQFDDCEEPPQDEVKQKANPACQLSYSATNVFDETEKKRRIVSSETSPLAIACSDPSDGVTPFDVLSGRGGGTNNHPGNQVFRRLCDERRPKYVLARKMEKREIARSIVAAVRSRGGRFLKKNEKTGEWFDIGDAKATSKTSQALREGLASKMRQALMASGAPKETQAMMATTVSTHLTPVLSAEERDMPPLPPLPFDQPLALPHVEPSSRIHRIDEPSSEYEQDSKRQRVSI